MVFLENDMNYVAPIEAESLLWSHRLNVYQRGPWYDYYNDTNSYLVKVMDYVTISKDLIY